MQYVCSYLNYPVANMKKKFTKRENQKKLNIISSGMIYKKIINCWLIIHSIIKGH